MATSEDPPDDDAPDGAAPDDAAPDDAAPARETPGASGQTSTGAGDRPLRARDLLKRTEQELDAIEAALDPAERAELASWFSRPSREVVEEQIAALTEDEVLDERARARQVKVAALAEAIAPWMIHLLERHTASTARMVRELVPPPAIIDETILRLPPVSLDEVAGARDFARPPDLDEALEQSVPQAVLRDLYRAETEFPLRLESPFDEPPPENARLELRAALRERHTMPRWPSTYETAMEARRTFRELIAGAWADKVAAVKAARDS